ncbi:MAG: hypothetical protein HQK79_16560 [Desulfobacterales bacterium]|nr:hypothetical protein [Desulfobacterales bacterium]MBF0398575.1 hypothetical protein [Desulfobacterales bacterium]
MKDKIIIIGAGAIGRGYLPWVIDYNFYDLVFVEANRNIVNLLNKNKKFKTFRSNKNSYDTIDVPVFAAYHPFEFFLKDYENVKAVFINVGPRNCVNAVSVLKGISCPIIMCENDPHTVEIVKDTLGYDRVYFAIPDVITSNTASEELLKKEPLAVITEYGDLFINQQAGFIKGDINFCSESELSRQWTAKLYLHNTAHCIAAYLGAMMNMDYVHEAMNIPEIRNIVVGAMNEMLKALKMRNSIESDFLEYYADKEIKRFSDNMLFDPITRVAREPLRKLEPEGRLIGASKMCLSLGFVPKNILTGIVSAILFENENDPDNQLTFLRKALSTKMLLTYIIGLGEGEVLESVMNEHFPDIILSLEELLNKKKVTIISDLKSDLKRSELALKAVSEGVEVLKRYNKTYNTIKYKGAFRDVVTDVDILVEEKIKSILRVSDYAIVGEESINGSNADVSLETPTWVIDPLDGTANYVASIPYYSISVGLIENRSFVIGAVILPEFKEIFFNIDSSKAYMNGTRLKAKNAQMKESLIVAAFSGKASIYGKRDAEYELFGKLNDKSRGCLRLGSAAVNICLVASGRLQAAYGIANKVWDVAGAIAVAKSAGYKLWTQFIDKFMVSYVIGCESIVSEIVEMIHERKLASLKQSP